MVNSEAPQKRVLSEARIQSEVSVGAMLWRAFDKTV
jgi:hypothetical protein